MRLAVRHAFAVLLLYVLGLGGLAVWLEYQIRSLAGTLMEETARLIGGEVAGALSGSTLDSLLQADPAATERLNAVVDNLAARSTVVSSLAVVDQAGRVVAGRGIDAGRQLVLPDVVFGGSNEVRLISSQIPFQGGTYHLFVPLIREQNLVGYLRLALRHHEIANLYERGERQLLIAMLAGVGGIAVFGLFLHVQLSRRGAALARALEGAVRGEAPPVPVPNEFAQALEAASRIGKELSEQRERSSQAHRQFNAVTQVMNVGVVLVQADGRPALANARACELLGCQMEQIEPRWAELSATLAAPFARLRAGQPNARADVDIGSDGPRRLRLEFYRMVENGHESFLVLVKDRALIEVLETDLRLATQMRALARLYLAVAHDVKAPLNAMVLNLELLKDRLEKRGEADDRTDEQQYVEVLREELARLNRFLETLLSQTAQSAERAERFDLRETVRDLERLLAPQARRQQVALTVEVPERVASVAGYPDRIKQALLNIALNGLEAMPNGGRLGIRLEVRDGIATVSISDTGTGIPPEVLGRIYDMHFTTKEGGTGVGMYVARSVVEAHGGDIQAHSDVGRGTSFAVQLPLAAAAA